MYLSKVQGPLRNGIRGIELTSRRHAWNRIEDRAIRQGVLEISAIHDMNPFGQESSELVTLRPD